MKEGIKRFKTDFLFTVPSLLTALGSIFNFSGYYFEYNTSNNGTEADNKAISSDWNMIGQDLNDAIIWFEAELELENEGKKKFQDERQLDLKLDA